MPFPVFWLCAVLWVGCRVEADSTPEEQQITDAAMTEQDASADIKDVPPNDRASVNPQEAPELEDAEATLEEPPPWKVVSRTTERIGELTWTRFTLAGHISNGWEWLDSTGDVLIFSPENSKSAVIGLPGWNFESRTWEDNAQISQLAMQYGVTVALPEMHKSIYETSFFPETNADYRWSGSGQIGGARWIGEVVLPFLQTTYGEVNGVFGLSTGGRGAVLVPQLYKTWRPLRACSMSGTFDLFSLEPSMGEYKIHSVIYGPRNKFPARWQADDTLSLLEDLRGVQVLLIHRQNDPHVPVSQSATLHDALQQRGLPSIFDSVEGGGHDWALWSHYVKDCFSFMSTGKRLPEIFTREDRAVPGADGAAPGEAAITPADDAEAPTEGASTPGAETSPIVEPESAAEEPPVEEAPAPTEPEPSAE